MISLFYTGSAAYNKPNSLASSSLGGYISNSLVQNGSLNSLFPPLSMFEIFSRKKIKNYIGLGLFVTYFKGNQQRLLDVVEDIKKTENISFKLSLSEENEDIVNEFEDIFSFKIGFGPISKTKEGDLFMESITSGAKPYYLSIPFKELKLNEEALLVKNVPSNGIGLWIERTFDPIKMQEKFGFDSNWWENHDNIPDFDFIFNLDINLVQ